MRKTYFFDGNLQNLTDWRDDVRNALVTGVSGIYSLFAPLSPTALATINRAMTYLVPSNRYMTVSEFSGAVTPFYNVYLNRTPGSQELNDWFSFYMNSSSDPGEAWNRTVEKFYHAVRGDATLSAGGTYSEGYIIIKKFYNDMLGRDPENLDIWGWWVQYLIEHDYQQTYKAIYETDEAKQRREKSPAGALPLIVAGLLLTQIN